jgi:uncharacterized membrane protein YeaQ/YmgE (transglycosylase-associated protein family)
MSIVAVLIALILGGLIVGALARLALPGPDPIGIPATIALGLVGSLVGGLIARAFLGTGGGIVFSVLGATALLYGYRRLVQKRGLTDRQTPLR